DVTGVFRTGSGLLFVPAPGARILDTRNAIGGWVYRQRFLQTIDTVAAPAGAKAVTGTITIVRPQFRGFLTAHACGQALPPTSSVNANAGLVMANSITVGVEPTQRTLCIYSSRNTNTLFDVVGWWVEAT
ncbi:MAG: SGNH/GDSL hydrolase family protein, partial [Actinomycetota bacterium]|nr:SGNH/GDSL hydrolase family protein [Actinomycetota bacterium]